jgi:uncharacterized protein YcbK (DUF882 family)
MMVTAHFALSEFGCRDGSPVPRELIANVQLLAEQLEALRLALGKPIRILSGYRSPAHNAKVKGKPKSRHLTAEAADIRVKGLAPEVVYQWIEKLIHQGAMRDGGLGVYPARKRRLFPPRRAREGFVHYDTRGKRARWRG